MSTYNIIDTTIFIFSFHRSTGSKVGFYYILSKVIYKEVKEMSQKLKMVSEEKLTRDQTTKTKTREAKMFQMWNR